MRFRKLTTEIMIAGLAVSSLSGCGKNTASEIKPIAAALKEIRPEELDYEITRTATSKESYSCEHVYNNYKNMLYVKEGNVQQYFDASGDAFYEKRNGKEMKQSPFYWEDLDVDYDSVSKSAFEMMQTLIEEAGKDEEIVVDKDVYDDGTSDMISLRFSAEDARAEISKYKDELADDMTDIAVSGVESVESIVEETEDSVTAEDSTKYPKTGEDTSSIAESVESAVEAVSQAEEIKSEAEETETDADVSHYGKADEKIDIMAHAQPLEMNFIVDKDRSCMNAFGISFLTNTNEVTTVTWNDRASVAQSYRYSMWHNGDNVPSLEEVMTDVGREMIGRNISYVIPLKKGKK